MWGSKASYYGVKAVKDSMKWHLVDETSLEDREVYIHWAQKMVIRTFGALMCGGKKNKWIYTSSYTGITNDTRIPLVLKDSINLNGAGVCFYCKNFRLKELGLENKVIG